MFRHIENYFSKHKIQFFIFNTILIVSILKTIQVFIYPETHFSEIFTKDNMRFLFFGRPGEIGGLALTFVLAIVSIFLSFFIGSLLGIMRWSSVKIIKIPAVLYIEIIRSIPLLMVIFWVFFAIPVFSMMFFHTQAHVSPTVAAIIAFTIFTSAYVAEIIRSGINSIPKGQFEAAKSLGMNSRQIFTLIILPQAYRKMIPALISQFISLFKDTSLAYTIGVIEFFRAATIINNRLYLSFEIFSFVALVYFSIAFSMSKFSEHLERKVEKQLNT